MIAVVEMVLLCNLQGAVPDP